MIIICMSFFINFSKADLEPTNFRAPSDITYYGFYNEIANDENNYRIYPNQVQNNYISADIDEIDTNSHYTFAQFYYEYNTNFTELIGLERQTTNLITIEYDVYTITYDFKFTFDDINYDTIYLSFIRTPSGAGNIDNVNLTNYVDDLENITSIEIQLHTNVKFDNPNYIFRLHYDLFINSELIYSFESDIETFDDTIKIYHSEFRHYWNSYNDLYGLRILYYDSTDYFDNFFSMVKFDEQIIFPSEKTLKKYWTYISYKIEQDDTIEVNFQQDVDFLNDSVDIDFSYEFSTIKGIPYNAKFYYNTEVIKRSDLGNWKTGAISWNWLRNGLCAVLNAILFFIQILFFVLIVALNLLIISWIVMLIIPFFWNYLIFGLLFILIDLLFWLVIFLVWLADLIINFLYWLFFDIIVPAFTYLVIVIFPIIIDVFILVISWILAVLLYMLSLGQADILVLQSNIQTVLSTLANFLMELMFFSIKYLPELLLYTVFYFVLIGFTYLKLIYCKAKGFVNRTEQLNSSLNSYIFPIEQTANLIIKVKEIILNWL